MCSSSWKIVECVKNSEGLPVANCSVMFTVVKDEEGNEKNSHGGENKTPVIQTVHYLYIQVQTCLHFQIRGCCLLQPAEINDCFSLEKSWPLKNSDETKYKVVLAVDWLSARLGWGKELPSACGLLQLLVLWLTLETAEFSSGGWDHCCCLCTRESWQLLT